MPEEIPLDDEAAERLRPALKLERFFPSRLKAKNLRMLLPHSGVWRYAPQEFIVHQGDSSRDVHVVLTGSVEITKTLGSAGAHIAALGPGDIFGEIALLQDGVRIANAVASEECAVFRLAFVDVQALMAGNAALAEHLRGLAESRIGGAQ